MRSEGAYFRPTVNDPFIPTIGSIWEHFKGHRYIVTGWARDSEDPTKLLVIYRRGGLMVDEFWARPESMWDEIVTDNQVRRFKFVGFAD